MQITPLLKHQQRYLDRLIAVARHSTRERIDASRMRQQRARAILAQSRLQLDRAARLRADNPFADLSRDGTTPDR